MMQCTEEVFRKDVAEHKMEILLDNGVHRHLLFKKPGRSEHWFDIVTWPGYLAIAGDMDSFMFTRLNDMFNFFRSSKPELHINRGYWEEKLEAVARHRGARTYLPELFTEKVEEQVKEWVEDWELTKEQEEDLRYEVEGSVLCAEDGEHEAHRVLSEFYHATGKHRFEFSDAWEWDLKGYTYHYTWCCYAIVWAIQQYDAVNREGDKF